MKALSRDPTSRARALKAEARANEASGGGVKGITIKPIGSSTGGFKKGGFKNAFAEAEGEKHGLGGKDGKGKNGLDGKVAEDGKENLRIGEGEESDEDVYANGEERYDPRRPTDCTGACER